MHLGIDIDSKTHYARAFDWCNYEYTKKPLEISKTKQGSGHSRHGWRSMQKSTVKPL